MRGYMAAAGRVFLGVALAAASISGVIGGRPALAKETKEFTSGNWTGFSYTNDDNGQFTDCTVWAFNDANVQIGISVKQNYNLVLWLNSDKWNLPDNQAYPVSFWVDQNDQHHGKAKVSGAKFVAIDVDDHAQDLWDQMKQGSQLTIRTSSEDYVFDLTGSRAALSKVFDCTDGYAKASTSNPFGGGGGDNSPQTQTDQQQTNQQQSNQQQSSQQQSSQQQTDSQSSGSAALKTLTVSSDDVKQFLVDVIGAKPSMITVNVKKDKDGAPYYYFTTPLGDGEFWQEQLGSDQLQNMALSYLDDYKSECKGDYAQTPNKTEQGQHGNLATGTAACSNSPYQSNGPEFISYSMSEVDGVVSIYLTYTGGNAAKAKSDSLGRLIAKRAEEQIK